FAFPFLLELLKHDDVEDKQNILSLISPMAAYGWDETLFVFWSERGAQEWADTAKQQYAQVREGIDIFLLLLNSDQAKVRIAASDILSFFKGDVDRIAPALCSKINEETDTQAKGILIKDLGDLAARSREHLQAHNVEFIDLFQELTDSFHSGFVRFMAT